jgi:ABC-2 type transport system permease protein
MKAFIKMLKTELVLSLRGMDMLIFAICMPAVISIILGAIYGTSPAFEGSEYTFIEQSFGALSAIAVCAGGLMGLPLVVADYRNKKILKRFKVTPTSPKLILTVQIFIYIFYSIISLILNYFILTVFFGYNFRGSIIEFLGAYFLVMLSMFSIGMLVGGVAPNTKIATVLACILYFPMLIFSGATLPYEVLPSHFQRIADFMPLTQGIKLLKSSSLGVYNENIFIPIIAMIFLGIICIIFSIKFFKWE